MSNPQFFIFFRRFRIHLFNSLPLSTARMPKQEEGYSFVLHSLSKVSI